MGKPDWKLYHMGHTGDAVFIGKIKRGKSGDMVWDCQSPNRNRETVVELMQAMRHRVDREDPENKPFFGYRMENLGTLVYIAPGYTFSVRPEVRKRNKA